MQHKNILCPVDFSEFSARAYRYALSAAQHYRAKLYVLHVEEPSRHPSAGRIPPQCFEEFHTGLLRACNEKLQELLKSAPDCGVQPELVVHRGNAGDCILGFAASQGIDLIVIGSHGRGGFDRLVLGSVTERVMRTASCPVLTVRKPAHDCFNPGELPDPIHVCRILFCTDFSENSQRAMEHAISLAEEYNAELTVLHVLEDSRHLPFLPHRRREAQHAGSAHKEEAIAMVEERLKELTPPEALKPSRIKTIVRIGRPYQKIVQFAEEAQIDLVVMAVRGRGSLDLAVFGSTAYSVIRLGPCPVVAVHV